MLKRVQFIFISILFTFFLYAQDADVIEEKVYPSGKPFILISDNADTFNDPYNFYSAFFSFNYINPSLIYARCQGPGGSCYRLSALDQHYNLIGYLDAKRYYHSLVSVGNKYYCIMYSNYESTIFEIQLFLRSNPTVLLSSAKMYTLDSGRYVDSSEIVGAEIVNTNIKDERLSMISPLDFDGIKILGNYILLFNSEYDFLICFEYLPGNKKLKYHDNIATQNLFNKIFSNEYSMTHVGKNYYFSSFNMNSKSGYPVINQNELLKYDYDLDYARQYNLYDYEYRTLNSFDLYIGKDRKGVYYFCSLYPLLDKEGNIISKGNGVKSIEKTYKNPEKRLVFIIVDPFSKRIIFRVLPLGSYNPPFDNDYYLLLDHQYTYKPWVDPEGNILFIHENEDHSKFVLKKVRNNWWKELGIENKLCAEVNNNRVRIRKEPSLKGEILGYGYECETVRILEVGKEETIDGITDKWYKVQFWDNRVGWMFGQYLDIGWWSELY